MALPIYPGSPLPAGIDRTRDWAVEHAFYDSGAHQAITPRIRPLMDYQVPYSNINEIKQGIVSSFWDVTNGGTLPFLMKDPYEYQTNSVLAVASGVTTGTRFLYDVRSWMFRVDTTTIGSFHSSESGFVTLGAHYNYDQDNGVLTVNTKAAADIWGVRSAQYFRKCTFYDRYVERGIIWNQFSVPLRIKEIV